MAEDLKLLLREMQTNNALTKELLAQKKLDDTPKQLLMGNLFEILNARMLFGEQKKELQKISTSSDKNTKQDEENVEFLGATVVASNNMLPALIGAENEARLRGSANDTGGLAFLGFTMANLFEIQRQLSTVTMRYYTEHLKILMVQSKLLKNVEGFEFAEEIRVVTAGFTKGMEKFQKTNNESSQAIQQAASVAFGSRVPGEPNENQALAGRPTTRFNQPTLPGLPIRQTAAGEEDKKDERNFYQKMIGAITKPFRMVSDGLKSFSENFVRNSALTTIIALLVSGLIAFIPAVAAFVADLVNMIGALTRLEFGEAFNILMDNKTGLFYVLLLLFRKQIINLIADAVTKALPFLSKLLLKVFTGPVGLTVALLSLVFYFKDEIIDFFSSAIDSVVDFFKNFKLSDLVPDFLKSEAKGMAMGGPVAAGTPYIVGEKGPELFVPGAAGGIIPNMGGGNIVVNNNQVNQSASSATHQHSNVTIVDRQQEQVGL